MLPSVLAASDGELFMFRHGFAIAWALACAAGVYRSDSALAGYDTTTPMSPDPHMIQTSDPVVYGNEVMVSNFTIDLHPGAPTLNLKGLVTGIPYNIDSFFDVFTELSFDSGQTWKPF